MENGTEVDAQKFAQQAMARETELLNSQINAYLQQRCVQLAATEMALQDRIQHLTASPPPLVGENQPFIDAEKFSTSQGSSS